jgi:hypothetical protein
VRAGAGAGVPQHDAFVVCVLATQQSDTLQISLGDREHFLQGTGARPHYWRLPRRLSLVFRGLRRLQENDE